MYDATLLSTSKRPKTDSNVIVNFESHETYWVLAVQFAIVKSCKDEWLELSGSQGSECGSEVVIVDLPPLDHLELLFGKDAWWTSDVTAAKLKLLEEWGLLRTEAFSSHTTVPADSLRLEKSARKSIEEKESLPGKKQALRKAAIDEKAVWRGVDGELLQLNGLVLGSTSSAVKLPTSGKLLEVTYTAMVRLREHVVFVSAEKAASNRLFDQVGQESEQRSLKMNAAPVARDRAKKLARLSGTEPVNVVDVMVWSTDDYAAGRLWQGLRKTH